MFDRHALGSRDLYQLIAVADAGSIRRAAEDLGMTQPGLSKNIRVIEERLGLSVFERDTTGTVMTEAGALIIKRGRQLLLELQGIVRDVREMDRDGGGIVRIASGPVPAPIVGDSIVSECLRTWPGIRVELTVGNVPQLIGAVERGDFDFILGHVENFALPPTLQYRRIVTVRGRFFARADHPLTELPSVPPSRLAEWPFASGNSYERYFDWFQAFTGVRPIVQFVCDDYSMIAEAMASSDMIAMTSESVLAILQRHHAVAPIHVEGSDYRHDINVISPAYRALSRPAQHVLDLIEKRLREPVPGQT